MSIISWNIIIYCALKSHLNLYLDHYFKAVGERESPGEGENLFLFFLKSMWVAALFL